MPLDPMNKPLLVLIAGRYLSGTGGDRQRIEAGGAFL